MADATRRLTAQKVLDIANTLVSGTLHAQFARWPLSQFITSSTLISGTLDEVNAHIRATAACIRLCR